MKINFINKFPLILKSLFVIALFIVLFIASITFKQINHLAKSSQMVTHSYQVTLELEHLISHLKDAETGNRGYIITKDSVYLKPFMNSRERVNNTFAVLKNLTKDNPTQQKNLNQLYFLINKRFVCFSKTRIFVLKNEIKNIEFFKIFKESNDVMNEIRAQINKMIIIENKLLDKREILNDNNVKNTPTYLYIIILFTLLLIILAYYKTNTDFIKIKEKNAQLKVYQELANQAEIVSKSGSWFWDVAKNEFYYSDNLYRLLDEEPQSFEPTLENFYHYIHPDHKQHVANEVEKMMVEKKLENLHYKLITKNGTHKYIKAFGKIVIDSNGAEKLVGTTTDITNDVERSAELERNNFYLKENNKQLKIYEESNKQAEILGNYGSWILNLENGNFSYSDNKFRLLGCKPQSFNPTIEKLLEFVYPDDQQIVLEGNMSIVEKGFLPTLIYRIIRFDDNQIRYFRTNAEIFEDSTGIKSVIGTTQDVTDEITNKNQLIQQNFELERSNNELSAFNYVASHDLQEPLRKIQTFISRLEDKEADKFTESGTQYLERIKNAATRMRLLIDDLLQFSRTNKTEKIFENFDLNELLDNAKQELAEIIKDKKATITNNLLPTLKVIPFQMQQLFINLINNSLKYSKPDIEPQINIEYEKINSKNEPFLANIENGKFHKITFQDNGIGFDNEYAERIFVLFSRLHNKNEFSGTGIGLSICKKIIENHNGYIFAQGTPNIGSVFTIYIPE